MNDSDLPAVAAPSSALVCALRRLLHPLVKLLLANSITYPYLANLLKSVYVEVADSEFCLEKKQQTDSRVSLLSGVHRKDVKRLRSEGPSGFTPMPSVSLGAQLVALWTSNALFLDAEGRHKPLPRLASEGGESSFEGLVAMVSKDMRSRVVLDEWLRIGVARMDERGWVCLNTDAFVPENGFEEKAFYFGENLHDHLSAAAHNLLGIRPAFMDRSVHYDSLSRASVEELAALSKELGMQALHAVNRRAMELQERDSGSEDANFRMNFGAYFYSAGQEESSAGK